MQNLYGNPNFTWWVGVVENRQDPEKLGRCKVRIFGYHTDDVGVLPTNDLPWATPMMPITSASTSGVGMAPLGPVEGTWVVGWFLDGDEKQQPIMMGTFTGKPNKNPVVEKLLVNEEIKAGNIVTTSTGSVLYDGSGQPVKTGNSANTDPTLPTDVDIPSVLPHPSNPTQNPAGPLNDPTFASQQGFADPNKIYPKIDYAGLPDTNKLATEDKSHKYFKTKEYYRKKNILTASGGSKWSEPTSAYNAQYPYNQVIETEAGHVIELDSSPNAERIHIYHKKGTYIEIDVNGTMVKKVIGDNYEVCDNNGYVYVKGAHNLTVGGPTKILIENNADIEVNGALNVTGHGSTLVQSAKTVQVVAKDIKVSGKSSLELTSDGPVNIQGSSITMNAKSGSFAAKASKDVALQSGSASKASIKGGLELLLDAATVKTKMGAITISATKLPVYDPPEEKTVSVSSGNSKLTRPDAPASIFLGDSLESEAADLAKKRLESGEVNSSIESAIPSETDTTTPNTQKPTDVDTKEFDNYDNFPDSLKLSKYVYLGDISTKAAATSYAVQDQNGLTKAQIVGNLKYLSVNAIDKIKEKYPDMVITSGFRAGTSSSDHNLGQAADLQFKAHSFSDYYDIAEWIKNNVPYKQVLLEYASRPSGTIAWIHIAASSNGAKSPMPIGTLANHSTSSPGQKNAFVKLV
jgi:hypothetical protein